MRLSHLPAITSFDARGSSKPKQSQKMTMNYLSVPTIKRQKQASHTPTCLANEARKFLSPLSFLSATKGKKKTGKRLPPLEMFSTFQTPVTASKKMTTESFNQIYQQHQSP